MVQPEIVPDAFTALLPSQACTEGMRGVAAIVGLFAFMVFDLAYDGGHEVWAVAAAVKDRQVGEA